MRNSRVRALCEDYRNFSIGGTPLLTKGSKRRLKKSYRELRSRNQAKARRNQAPLSRGVRRLLGIANPLE